MIQSLKTKLKSLIDAYQTSKASGELEEETEYGARMESYRKWLRENILDLEKLHNYSDADFSEKFGELFDYVDGNPGLTRGMHFKSNEKRLEVRTQFENMVGFINGHENDRYSLLDEILNPNSAYKVPGLGKHVVTALINAKYPDVPPINATTRDFFKNIGETLPTETSEQQREVNQFFTDMKALSNDELTLDDINHICWYTKNIPSGISFMESNFPSTYEREDRPRRASVSRKKKHMTREEQLAARIAELEAIRNRSINQ